jgi:exodeoxyribonuclease-3
MRIITYNVNGIRAAIKKGFLEWLSTNPADIICVQEIKANEEDVPKAAIEATGYHVYSYSAQKKGYSGVAILCRTKPTDVIYGNEYSQSNAEGRLICALFGDLYVVNAYFPSGTSGEERQTYKYQWLSEFYAYIQELHKNHSKIVICGDYNICHKAIDIHDPVRNKNYTGFLPEERAWMEQLFTTGFVDTFREFNKEPHQYTWWSQLGQARANNKGWRIDYISVSEPLRANLRGAAIYPTIVHSDHCPMYMEMEL